MDEFALEVAKKLIEVAKAESTIYYSWLDDAFHIPCGSRGKNLNPVHKAFYQIVEDDIRNDKPLLTSVVIKKSNNKTTLFPDIPSDEYFEMLSKVRKIDIPNGKKNRRPFHRKELEAVYSYYVGK